MKMKSRSMLGMITEEIKELILEKLTELYVKQFFEDKQEQDYLLEMQQLFRESIDYL